MHVGRPLYFKIPHEVPFKRQNTGNIWKQIPETKGTKNSQIVIGFPLEF